ncbi:MAG: restriction endonuclease subunit S, partial [Bacteroidetes bacterium]
MTDRVVTSSKECITDAAIVDNHARLVKKGTLLMSFKLTIGKLAFAGKDLFTNEAIAAFTIKEQYKDSLLSEFLYWALHAIPLEKDATLAVKGKTLNKKKMAVIPIPLPDIVEQRRIVARIEALLAEVREMRKLHDEITADANKLMDAVRSEAFYRGKPLPAEWEYRSLEV